MNPIDEEEEEEDDDDMAIIAVDQFPSVRPPPEYNNHYNSNNNICSSKQTRNKIDRTKYQTVNRSTSLPSRQSFPSIINIEDNVKQRRRYASDSNNNNNNTTTSLVTSFIQYLRSELRATTNDQKLDYLRTKKKKSCENINYLSETFNLPNNFYRQQYPIRMSTSPSLTSSSESISHCSNENLLKNTFDNNDDVDQEIVTLINLLILRVECLTNENTFINKKKKHQNIYPTIKQIDQNLIEYLYYLFNKFTKDDSDFDRPIIDKTNFVNVCQTLVRNGGFNIPPSTSPDQSFSESTITNSGDLTLTQTCLHEYRSDMSLEKSLSNEQISSPSMNDQDTWLVVDLSAMKPQYSATTPDLSKCLLPSSTSDDQLLLPNENYFSLEEIKSCESESSHSNYYSPNSSLVDLQNMVQEFDDVNNNNNNNNNTLFNEDGSSSTEHTSNNTNVIIETNDTTSNNNLCIGLTNDCSRSNEHIASSSMESTEPMTTNLNNKMSRRERKMQERWTITTKNDNNNNNEQFPTKTFLGVEFPPIAVLRRKFSSLPPPTLNPLPIKKKDSCSIKTNPLQNNIDKSNEQILSTTFNSSMSLQNQEINTSIVDKTKYDQVLDLHSNDISSLNDSKTNDIDQSFTTVSELLVDEKNDHEDMTTETTQDPMLSSIECPKETITNINNDTIQQKQMNINSSTLNSSSSSLLSISSSMTTNINENKTIELLSKETKEEEEEGKKEEEYGDDDNNVGLEKKNNSNVEHNYHASGTILINNEPTKVVLLEQEKEEEQETEQPSSLLSTVEQCNQQRSEKDESLVQILSNNLEQMTVIDIDENEQRYKTVEIEEIPDEEETLSVQNNYSIEPIDCILTDDELKIPRQSNIKPTNNASVKVDPVLSCYEKALSNAVETIDDSTKLTNVSSTTKRTQRPEDDPIALRALERFEQRMNAAAVAAKTSNDGTNSSITKGKSSWSGALSTPRKSVENLFKTHQQLQSTSPSNSEESSSSTTTSPQRDSFIRPRKTMLDDIGLNFGMTLNLFGTVPSNCTNNDSNHKLEEQQQPTAITEDDSKPIISNESTNIIDSEDHQQEEEEEQPQQSIMIHSLVTNESSFSNETENFNSVDAPSLDSSLNTVISHSSSEPQSLAPYRLQIEGRRRLNTLERIRERHQNHDSNDSPQQQQQQHQSLQNEYTLKPEELQDPIIRRALERFDEKSRSLAQSKSTNYDEIQDPITRRAIMRLETNLKRTMPSNPPSTINDPNETWYTNSYILGSLQSNNDNRFTRYPESSLPPTSNHKTSHVSVHQRFCATSSSDMPELSTNNLISNNEPDIPIMRVPTQPVYVTSNNQQQQQPISLRQRSRSEDMLSSRDLSVGQTTNLDDSEPSQLQRNHSSDDLQEQEAPLSNETDFQLPDAIIKSLDPNFIRKAEASVNYATPTQTYSGYSCEYTRPHGNQSIASSQSELLSPRNLEQENQIEYSTPSLSAFTPVQSSTNNYYPQQPLPIPSYTSMYTSNNSNQTPYSDDPIVRRALERFNCQMQNSLMNISQHQPNLNYMPRQYSNGYLHQGNIDSFQPPDPYQYDTWSNSTRPMPPLSNTNTGYQSIIGRRRQVRHDDVYHDNTSVGNGYSSSLFLNSQNPYPYMNFSDEPPVIPPRLHRDMYHEQPEYISENVNNNNNNSNPYAHHAYPGTTNGFHPINHQYIPSDCFQQFQENDYSRHRVQSTSSTASSDSVNPIRSMHHRLPPTSTRPNLQQNKTISPDNSQLLSGETTPSNGSAIGDSVFHRLAYTATKASLSKSSSNLYANLSNKNPPPLPPPSQQQNKSKSNEIDDEELLTNNENNQESISTPTNFSNKCQRSRSVDGRARLKNAQARMNHNHANRSMNDCDDNHSTTTTPSSSKSTSMNSRRDVPPPSAARVPTTPRSGISDRTSLTKRAPSGNNLAYTRNGIRGRGSHGNLIDTDNEESFISNDNYQPKILDHKIRPSIPGHRYPTNSNNHIQTSASTSSVNSTISRTKLPLPTSANLDRRDSNKSSTDLNRSLKRSDDHRVVSPPGQRRNIPVSVFAPAKLEHKRSAPLPPPPPSSTSPTNDSTSNYNCESQQEQQISYSPTGDSSYPTIHNENEINNKLSSSLKTSTGNIMNELSLTHDKHDNSKKMNVFERLFRGHKKKV